MIADWNTERVFTQDGRSTIRCLVDKCLIPHTPGMDSDTPAKRVRTAAAIRAGERIRRAREEQRLTLVDLARRTDGALTHNRISNYEQGLREPSVDVAERLGRALGVPAAWLLGLISDADRDLLSYPPRVRSSALQVLRDTAQAAREERPVYGPDVDQTD